MKKNQRVVPTAQALASWAITSWAVEVSLSLAGNSGSLLTKCSFYLRFVKNDYYVKEEKQDGRFQLTGHVIVISFNSTPSGNGPSVTHRSGPHRRFCEGCVEGRPGWGPPFVQPESGQLP